jgi:hypothetical protein
MEQAPKPEEKKSNNIFKKLILGAAVIGASLGSSEAKEGESKEPINIKNKTEASATSTTSVEMMTITGEDFDKKVESDIQEFRNFFSIDEATWDKETKKDVMLFVHPERNVDSKIAPETLQKISNVLKELSTQKGVEFATSSFGNQTLDNFLHDAYGKSIADTHKIVNGGSHETVQ